MLLLLLLPKLLLLLLLQLLLLQLLPLQQLLSPLLLLLLQLLPLEVGHSKELAPQDSHSAYPTMVVAVVAAAAALNLSDFKLEDSETSRSLENKTSFSFQQK